MQYPLKKPPTLQNQESTPLEQCTQADGHELLVGMRGEAPMLCVCVCILKAKNTLFHSVFATPTDSVITATKVLLSWLLASFSATGDSGGTIGSDVIGIKIMVS